ncbi:hypothetical protein E5D57_012384 [Metarhizium anisopliae]|nr:hypothetical protein E5D57_012384 [Metarhizium anisopliae]
MVQECGIDAVDQMGGTKDYKSYSRQGGKADDGWRHETWQKGKKSKYGFGNKGEEELPYSEKCADLDMHYETFDGWKMGMDAVTPLFVPIQMPHQW